jgi:uncharacterized protein YndB with AHSA1/START domain
MPSVARSIEIASPPSVVWRWFATEDGLRQWITPHLEIDLQVGGSYRLRNEGQDTWVRGTVLEVVPEGSLVLSWFEEGSDWVHPARLVFTLVPTEAGTRVSLSHDGFPGIGKASWPSTVQAYERGADRHRILERLAEVVGDGQPT